MKFDDIIALAKAGYKVGDIKELMALDTNNTTEPPKEEKPVTDNNDNVDINKTVEEPTKKEEPEEKFDYKLLYEESQKALAQAQKLNINTQIDNDNKLSADDILNEFLF